MINGAEDVHTGVGPAAIAATTVDCQASVGVKSYESTPSCLLHRGVSSKLRYEGEKKKCNAYVGDDDIVQEPSFSIRYFLQQVKMKPLAYDRKKE